ncbi:hypothetical protein [Chromobacterium amazonense]|uniref:hypothetical protein n=1 Tax=Chromobacterium amazonense TaxID=1382803 RepID=UPI0031F70079
MPSIRRTQSVHAVDVVKNKTERNEKKNKSVKPMLEESSLDIFHISGRLLEDVSDFDEEKVKILSEALKNGTLSFNAEKLANMIQQFHGVAEDGSSA